MTNKAFILLYVMQTAAGAAIAAQIMDGTQALLPFFAGSFLVGVILTLGSQKWRTDLTYLALAVVFGTISGLTASRRPGIAWAAEWIAILATPAGPLLLTSIRENPAAAVDMIAAGIKSVRSALFGKHHPPSNFDDTE